MINYCLPAALDLPCPLLLRAWPAWSPERAAPQQPLRGEELGGLPGLHHGATLLAPELPAPGADGYQHEGELVARTRRPPH